MSERRLISTGSPFEKSFGYSRAVIDREALTGSETIEIEVCGDCRVRVGSSFDARALRRVLDVLRKR